MRARTLTLKRAKSLRRTMTPPETRLWVRLRTRQPGRPNFRRQFPLDPYILDFYCPEAKLAVEVDGWIHSLAAQAAHDEWRDAFLKTKGVEIMRLAAADVMTDPEAAAEAVWGRAILLVSGRGE